MKIIVGTALCIIGAIVWAAPLIAASLIGPTVMALGAIGGGIIMSGIALICLATRPTRVPYFDERL